MLPAVMVLSRLEEAQVRFRFVVVVEAKWKQGPELSFSFKRVDKHFRQPAYGTCVTRPHGTHLDDLAVDEFGADVVAKYADFGHLVVLIHREKPLRGFSSHG